MLWLLLTVLLACSGMVSASETALFGLNRRALNDFRRSSSPLRRQVHAVMQQPHQVLMTVLIANTAVNVAIFTAAYFVLRGIANRSAFGAAVGAAAVPLSIIVFGEMLPKALALSNPRHFAPSAAGLIASLQIVLGPVQRVLDSLLIAPITRLLAPSDPLSGVVTTDELRLLVERSASEGVINTTENEMLQAIVALGAASVREVMTPRVDIRSAPLGADRAALLETFRASGRRRLPVCDRDLDDIRGVLYRRDLYLHPQEPVKRLVRRVPFVPEQLNLVQLLRHFRSERITMAIVVDEYGGTAGLVTIQDIVQWIVGDLPDADGPRRAAPTERIDEHTYRLSGQLSVRDWADRFGVREIDRCVDTVAGVILSQLGRVPRPGDSIRLRNLTLVVESMKDRRIDRVLLRHDPAPGAGSAARTAPEPGTPGADR